MIQYVALGGIGQGQVVFDVLVNEIYQKNYSAYMNHALSVFKLDESSFISNKKTSSSFGNWISGSVSNLGLIVLVDSGFGDQNALAFLKDLGEELKRNYQGLILDPSNSFN